MGPQYYGTPVRSNYVTSGSTKYAPTESVTYYFNYTSTLSSSALPASKFNFSFQIFLAVLFYIQSYIIIF